VSSAIGEYYTAAAICKWVIALIYAVYIWSFAINFILVVRTRHYASTETEVEMAIAMDGSEEPALRD
jgi:hypothetical protein